MGSITIAGTAISDFVSAYAGGVSVPAAGIYYAMNVLGEPPCFGPIISDQREVKFAGLDWCGGKDFGKVKRLLYAEIIWVQALLSLRAAVQTSLDAWQTNTRYSIIINGVTFQGCKLQAPDCARAKRLELGAGVVGEKQPLVFKQLSDTN